MNIFQLIDSLIIYGQKHNLINKLDYDFYVNEYLNLFGLSNFVKVDKHLDVDLDIILANAIEYAIDNKIIDNTNESKDLFDTKIMGILTPLPSKVINKFNKLKKSDAILATNYLYKLSKDVNYIRTSRIKKDVKYIYNSKFGKINISINLSKPEKDPNDIKKLLNIKNYDYPKCQLCKENENYYGHIGYPARQTLRCVPITLNKENFYIQYSPYSYFNEHLICFHKEHFNMHISENTFKELIDFVSQFPHYFIGSNADLPIVGGSILNHYHFQGGKATLPMENAQKVFIKEIDNIKVYRLLWPLAVIRLIGQNKNKIIKVATTILQKWQQYKNVDLNIINYNENGLHNTITPIVRKKGRLYEFDLVLRNNISNDDYPLGYFHPNEKYWHIKKENIGLIEVMGLAILPARLHKELELVKKYLLNEKLSVDDLNLIEKHLPWIYQLQNKHKITIKNVDKIIKDGVGEVFVNVLKDCNVFKKSKQNEFDDFLMSI